MSYSAPRTRGAHRALADPEVDSMDQSPTNVAQTQFTTPERTELDEQAWIRPWLRAEGFAVFAAGFAGFVFLGLPWWAFLLLLIVPDVSMVGYLRGPRVGAIV
jgi:hypothetical protein